MLKEKDYVLPVSGATVAFENGTYTITNGDGSNIYFAINKALIEDMVSQGYKYVTFYLATNGMGNLRINPGMKYIHDKPEAMIYSTTSAYLTNNNDYFVYDLNKVEIGEEGFVLFKQDNPTEYCKLSGLKFYKTEDECEIIAHKLYNTANWLDISTASPSWKVTGNSVEIRGWQPTISAAWVQEALEAGYTHMRIEIGAHKETSKYLLCAGSSDKIVALANGVVRLDLTGFKKADGTYNAIIFQGKPAVEGTQEDTTITFQNIKLFKSAETTSWTKSNPNIYCAIEEDGVLVLDTLYSGNDAHVKTSTTWLAALMSKNGEYVQGTIHFETEMIVNGTNTRALVFGINNAVGGIEFPGTGDYTNITYSDGDVLYLGLDHDGVIKIKVSFQ